MAMKRLVTIQIENEDENEILEETVEDETVVVDEETKLLFHKEILMISPSGYKFKCTISDDGQLVTQKLE